MRLHEGDHEVLFLETALNFLLDVGVLDLLVVLEDGFDFLDDLVEGPLGEFRSNFYVLELARGFD